MNNKRAVYFYVALGCVSLVGGVLCLAFADTLGGFKFLGASAAIFLAMLSFTQVSALRRAQAAAPRPARVNVPSRAPDDSMPAPLAAGPRSLEDAELAARLAALRAARAQPAVARFATPELEAEPEPAPEPEADAAVVVIEGPPLESMPAELDTMAPAEPAPVREPVGLRQMDELRAEIARLRDGTRKRHAGGAASEGPREPAPEFERTQIVRRAAPDPFARTEFSSLPEAPAARPAAPTDAFARTEFSGLADPAPEKSSFTKTEFLGPIDLPR